MAHVEPLSSEDALANSEILREQAGRMESQFGFIPNSIRTMSRVPALANGFLLLQKGVMTRDGAVPFEVKKLVSHIASKAAGCLYCQAHTSFTSGRGGMEAAKLEALWDYRTSALFSDAEKVALDYALAAASVPNMVDDALMVRMKDHWTDEQIVEILGVVSFFGFLNRWNDSMATELELPAAEFATNLLGEKGWDVGKHG